MPGQLKNPYGTDEYYAQNEADANYWKNDYGKQFADGVPDSIRNKYANVQVDPSRFMDSGGGGGGQPTGLPPSVPTPPSPLGAPAPGGAPTPDSMGGLNKVVAPPPVNDTTSASLAGLSGGGGGGGGSMSSDAGLIGGEAGTLRPMARRNPPQESMALAGLQRRAY